VFVGTPADAALSAARTNLAEMLLYGTMSLLIGALLAARLGVRIAQPLRMLAYDAMLFARGNLAHRTKVAGDDETGVLAATLNRMAQMIEDRTQALHDKTAALELKTQALTRSTTELSTITANVPVLIAYVDASETFRFVNEYVHDVFGVTPTEVVGRTLRDMLGAKVHARLDERMRDVLAGLPQTFETSFAPEPRRRCSSSRAFPTTVMRTPCSAPTSSARTSRVARGRTLEARERFIRLIADGARADHVQRYVERLRFGNKRFAEYWETDLQAIVGRRVADVVSPPPTRRSTRLLRSYRGETRRFDLVVDRADRDAITPGRPRAGRRCARQRPWHRHDIAGRHGAAAGEAGADRVGAANADDRRQPAGADRLLVGRPALPVRQRARPADVRARAGADRRPQGRRPADPGSVCADGAAHRRRAQGEPGALPADADAQRAPVERARRIDSRP
jgi:HAMP domain-containing protein